MAVENIVLSVDDEPVGKAIARANKGLDEFEKKAARAHSVAADASERSGERTIRVLDRTRTSQERFLQSIEKRARFAGADAAERLRIEERLALSRVAGDDRAVARVENAYARLRAVQGEQLSIADRLKNALSNPLEAASSAASSLVARLGPLGTGLAAVATAGVAAGAAAFKIASATADWAENLGNASARTGIAASELHLFQVAARSAGIGSEVFENSQRELSRVLGDVGDQGRKGREALLRLGIQATDTRGRVRPMSTLFLEISDAIGRVQEPAQRLRLLQDVLGRVGLEALPLFNGQLRESVDGLRAMGVGLEENAIRKISDFDGKLDALSAKWDDLKLKLKTGIVAVVDFLTPDLRPGGSMTAAQARDFFRRQGLQPSGGEFIPGQNARNRAQTIEGLLGGVRELDSVVRGSAIVQRALDGESRSVDGLKTKLAELKTQRAEAFAAVEAGRRQNGVGGLVESEAASRVQKLQEVDSKIRTVERQIERLGEVQRTQKELAEGARKLNETIGSAFTDQRLRMGMFDPDKNRFRIAGIEELAGQRTVAAGLAAVAAGRVPGVSADQSRDMRLRDLALERQSAAEAEQEAADRRVGFLERESRLQEHLVSLRTGPGGERQATEETYRIRLELAQQVYQVERRTIGDTLAGYKLQAAEDEARIARIQSIADIERQRFDRLRDSVGSLFDAVISRTGSALSVLRGMLTTALLAPIKETFSNYTARFLSPLMYGGRGGGFGPMALGLGGVGSIVGGPGGTGGFTGPVGGYGGGGGLGSMLGFGGILSSGRGLLGQLGNLGRTNGLDINGNFAGFRSVGGAAGGAMLLGGGTLAMMGLQRGGLSGLAMTAGGGALIGAKFGGPIGALIGGAIGGAAGLVRMFFKGAAEKAREKIQAVYGIRLQDRGILNQIVDTARQGFGGNLDVAIRSPQIRDLIELYAMTTGQSVRGGFAPQMRPYTFAQSGSMVSEVPAFVNGSAVPNIGSAGSQPIVIQNNITLDPGATREFVEGRTVDVINGQPRLVTQANNRAMDGNYRRRESAGRQLFPSLVVG